MYVLYSGCGSNIVVIIWRVEVLTWGAHANCNKRWSSYYVGVVIEFVVPTCVELEVPG